MTPPHPSNLVVVRGAGDLASGVIHTLAVAGYSIVALEKPDPEFVRRLVCFGEAFYTGEITIAEVTAKLTKTIADVRKLLMSNKVPVLIDPKAISLKELKPAAVIDARMLKEKTDSTLNLALIVIGLGPGFTAGKNCHFAVETMRGKNLGRIFRKGGPMPDTGQPTEINGVSGKRVLRAPASGIFTAQAKITHFIKAGQIIGKVAGDEILAEINGILRGIIHDGIKVEKGQKIGDIDPRADLELCYQISDKAQAVGRSVLAILNEFDQN